MNLTNVLGRSALAFMLLVGCVASPVLAQQEHKEQLRRTRQEKPQDRKKRATPKRSEGRQEQDHPQARPAPRGNQDRLEQRRMVWQRRRAGHWQSEHRTWQQRGGYTGHRIPEGRMRGYFGPAHPFRIHQRPVTVVGGLLQFSLGGFGFHLVDPWPETWSSGWLMDDDVYIDFVEDGYYLHNRRHPRDRVAISVTVR